MIYVATVHYMSARWIEVQRRYLEQHIGEPYRVYACLEGLDAEWDRWFDRVVPAMRGHAGKLNLLAAAIAQDASPDDLIFFLDGDAFPIADPMPSVSAALEDTNLVAIRRAEAGDEPQPHPSFCATTVGFWSRIHGDWSPGYPWGKPGTERTDPGGNLLFLLDAARERWTPLLRTNRVNLHRIFFGIYGDFIYHHGAGFRSSPPITDRDTTLLYASRTISRQTLALVRVLFRYRKRIKAWQAMNRLSEDIYRQIVDDVDFYQQFLVP